MSSASNKSSLPSNVANVPASGDVSAPAATPVQGRQRPPVSQQRQQPPRAEQQKQQQQQRSGEGKPQAARPPREGQESRESRDAARAAREGNPTAKEVFELSGAEFGRALSMLIDLFNPQRIVVGGIFSRCRDLIWPAAERVIAEEALPDSRKACTVLPCELSESIGDMAALSVAVYYWEHGGEGKR